MSNSNLQIAVRAILNDIEAMQEAPDNLKELDPDAEAQDWFGWFDMSIDVGTRSYIEWPNLRIGAEQLRAALSEPSSEVEGDTAITAMCLWEAWLDPSHMRHVKYETESGASADRYLMLELAPHCDASYAIAVEKYDYNEPFDWEFVPRWMDLLFSTVPDEDYTGLAQRSAEDFARHIAEEVQP